MNLPASYALQGAGTEYSFQPGPVGGAGIILFSGEETEAQIN